MKSHINPSRKSFADLRHEREIASLKQTIQSLTGELELCRSQLALANAQIAWQERTIGQHTAALAEWERRYNELLDMSESMQRSLYVYEEHAGSEDDVRIDAAIMQLMELEGRNGERLFTMGRQWWGVYRVLVDHYGYPASHTAFVKRLTARGMDKARIPLKLNAMKAISGTIFEKPLDRWQSLAHKVPAATFNRHYDVAVMIRNLLNSG